MAKQLIWYRYSLFCHRNKTISTRCHTKIENNLPKKILKVPKPIIRSCIYQKKDIPVNKTFVQTHLFSWWRSISHRNQSIDVLCKSMDWFLHDRNLRHERANNRNLNGFWYMYIVLTFHAGKYIQPIHEINLICEGFPIFPLIICNKQTKESLLTRAAQKEQILQKTKLFMFK